MSLVHTVRSRLVAVPLLGLALALSGCVDEKKVIAVLEQCPKAVDRIGRPYKISRTWKIGSPGVPEAPVPSCTHKALLEGPTFTAELWFNEKDPDLCFHMYTPTGATRTLGPGSTEPVIAVTDVRSCSEGIQ